MNFLKKFLCGFFCWKNMLKNGGVWKTDFLTKPGGSGHSGAESSEIGL